MPQKNQASTSIAHMPASRVLRKTSVPLRQAKFPVPNKRIRTYATKAPKRIPALVTQDTLTQIWGQDEFGDEDEDIENKDEEYLETSEKRKKRRRKTTGDELDIYQDQTKKAKKGRRKTLGDTSISDSQQTLTQMVGSPRIPFDDDSIEDGTVYDVPNSSQYQPPLPRRKAAGLLPNNSENAVEMMPPPQTPRKFKLGAEIPSSQSPATPCSSRSRGMRMPLQERSINTSISFSTTSKPTFMKIHQKTPHLEVRDTFNTEESQETQLPSTPSKKLSPAKSVRFWLPDEIIEDDEEELEDTEPELSSIEIREPEIARLWKGTDEVADSESDSGFDTDVEDILALPTVSGGGMLSQDLDDPTVDVNTTYDAPTLQVQDPGAVEDAGQETYYDADFGMDTQFHAERIMSTVESSCRATEPSQLAAQEENIARTRSHYQATQVREGRSQFLSQRLSTQHVGYMAPRTPDSDSFISISTPQVQSIKDGKRDHIIKAWYLPPSTVRLWLYEPAPKSRIRYMATIGPVKRPGDILNDGGEGNAEFDAKPLGNKWSAYEILELYELADPVTFEDCKERGWFKAAPSKFVHVKPVPLDELMANLLPPIFTRYDDKDESVGNIGEHINKMAQDADQTLPVSSSTDMQEAVEQLEATMRQFTQSSDKPAEEFNSDPPILVTRTTDDDIHSEPQLTPLRPNTSQPLRHPGPSQAETVDDTQYLAGTPTHRATPEIVLESPTRPVSTSTPQLSTPRVREFLSCREPSSTPRLPRHVQHDSSQPHEMSGRSGSIVPFSMHSSQFLSKSQLLPESLLQNSIPGPTMFVGDSEDDEDYDYKS
ncbi:hypothetical protein BJ878DRAFT_415479 [Calycina marina]|uniref:Uncharacterized protein n=1 Tax=Calycina marina TaxID=1763456 RepID=A0A9P7Z7N8_9HELO|nr:hypothetical protein BJ878DRAFT_415479 [Calycina marina]